MCRILVGVASAGNVHLVCSRPADLGMCSQVQPPRGTGGHQTELASLRPDLVGECAAKCSRPMPSLVLVLRRSPCIHDGILHQPSEKIVWILFLMALGIGLSINFGSTDTPPANVNGISVWWHLIDSFEAPLGKRPPAFCGPLIRMTFNWRI